MSIIGQLTTEGERLALTFAITAFAVPFFVGVLGLEYTTVAGGFVVIGLLFLLFRFLYRGGRFAKKRINNRHANSGTE